MYTQHRAASGNRRIFLSCTHSDRNLYLIPITRNKLVSLPEVNDNHTSLAADVSERRKVKAATQSIWFQAMYTEPASVPCEDRSLSWSSTSSQS